MPKPTLKQTLDALKNQVLIGKAYLEIASGLLKANQDDPVILQTAQVFFGLTINGSLELAQMAIARLYDTTGRAVSVRVTLFESAQQMTTFRRGTPAEVRDAILRAVQRVISIQPVLNSIRRRRNEWLAHLDQRTVTDPKALSEEAKLTVPDLRRVFKETEEMLIELSNLHEGTFGELRFVGSDDYKSALENLRRYKCAYIREYEKQFGPWTGPRPKDCSQASYDLV